MKLFGKELFNFKGKEEAMWDFVQFGLLTINILQPLDAYITPIATIGSTSTGKVKKEPKKIYVTPKSLYEMRALNDNKFTIKADKTYLEEQIANAEYKLTLMGKNKKPRKNEFDGGAIKYGRDEVKSIIERLENRKRLREFTEKLEKYPHTTNDLINEVLNKNSNLRLEKSESFVPDFPKEAIKAMKEYNEMCQKLCDKKSVFYVIASKEDFVERNRRRDPILLAQSPFGFFWQILGAWDSEMVYLEDL